ncbi:MAG: TetR/AcrR family transcriptional regulator C-terminal domain-containing protein [Oscillospiraceae bacterium]|nr:TetR/AcrR family transcriptional regulator C-terminal domain-containing protein [Oscillospiraceae bacterium]
MSSSTKEALGAALKKMMAIKPIDKITVKDLAEICKVNRQTFYYHFDDVYDLLEWVFEADAEKNLPHEVKYERWREDVSMFFKYLMQNADFALNIYNSPNRTYMLRFYKQKLQNCIRSFAVIVSRDMLIDRRDFEFVVEFYANCVVGVISQWLDLGMQLPDEITVDQCLTVLDNSVENLLKRFDHS